MISERLIMNDMLNYISKNTKIKPKVGLVLGSGLGGLAEEITNPEIIEYQEVPGFPVTTVTGHRGRYVMGRLEGNEIMIMDGRIHYYEGYSMKQVTMPIRVMAKLGIELVIVTNSAGGINSDFSSGDLMVITDHINMTATNPLIGPNIDELGERFPDMTNIYDKDIINLVEGVSENTGIPIKKGVYAFMTGPSYETPAEINMLRCIGADAVGMSTVPEVIIAHHGGMKVLGMSCISNMAAGISKNLLTHKEVIDTTDRVKDKFKTIVRKVLNELSQEI